MRKSDLEYMLDNQRRISDLNRRFSLYIDELNIVRLQMCAIADHLGMVFKFREDYPKVQLVEKEVLGDKNSI